MFTRDTAFEHGIGRFSPVDPHLASSKRLRNALVLAALAALASSAQAALEAQRLAPGCLALTEDSTTLYVGSARMPVIQVFDLSQETVRRTLPLPAPVTGIAVTKDGSSLVATVEGQQPWLVLMDAKTADVKGRWPAGRGACSPVLSRTTGRAYVCNRFEGTVAAYDLGSGKLLATTPVLREPFAATLTPDEKILLVANHLPAGAANQTFVAAAVTVIETTTLSVRTNLTLPSGSVSLRGIYCAPDGRTAWVTHNLARFQGPAVQLTHGWMNDAALTAIDMSDFSKVHTILLDESAQGAANPWEIAGTSDGKFLCISHSGTHELSIIRVTGLLERIRKRPPGLIDDLNILDGLRKRVKLAGNGPRAITIAHNCAFVAEYFSDSISSVDVGTASLLDTYPLSSAAQDDPIQRGERLFYDATLSRQGWQSCASCHPDARVDGLNWDLLNDGVGNHKNTKSLLLSHATPPAMSLGVRGSAETAVRSGMQHILFTQPSEESAKAIDVFLKSLQPIASPFRTNGSLSANAIRGKVLFESSEVGCSGCHSGALFTDLKSYDVGTGSRSDGKSTAFDTPTLIECWRTAPYLHDGSAVSIRDVLTVRNRDDRHGKTSRLTDQQLAELEAFVLSN